MLTGQQLDQIGLKLTHDCGSDNFAFYAIPGMQTDYDVYYATPYTAPGGVQWCAAVLALQHLAGKVSSTNPPLPVLYLGTSAQHDNAAIGMRLFLQLQHGRHQHGGRWALIMNSGHPLNYATFHRIDPRQIVDRAALDAFIPNLGHAPGIPVGYDQASSHFHRLYMALAFRRVRDKFIHQETGHKIAAVLVDPLNGAVRAIAHNTRTENYTFHAEVNLVQACLKSFPHEKDRPFNLYSTLQPCPMCAAMIRQYLPEARVFYGQADPGTHMGDLLQITPPKFSVPLSPPSDFNKMNWIKPLRGWDENDYRRTSRHDGNQSDTFAYLGTLHKNAKHRNRHVLTQNLNSSSVQTGIENAARTLDRKREQVFGENPKPVPTDWTKMARRNQIRDLIAYLLPLIQ